jgi:hypothetical protein
MILLMQFANKNMKYFIKLSVNYKNKSMIVWWQPRRPSLEPLQASLKYNTTTNKRMTINIK